MKNLIMGKYLIIHLFIILLLTHILFTGCSDTSNSEKEAIRLANHYLGFDSIDGYSIADNAKAELIKMNFDSTSPIIHMTNNSKIYKVIFQNISINDFRRTEDNRMVDFEVLLDSESGKLLHISSIFKKTSIAANRQDSTSFLWRFYGNINRAYFGLPNEKPYPFMEILRRAPTRLSEAIALEAFYILLSPSKEKPANAPRWFLYLDGVPKIVSPPQILADSGIIRGHGGIESVEFNIVFDGITGEPLTSGGQSKKE